MAKKFHFDDEDEIEDDISQSSHVDELEMIKHQQSEDLQEAASSYGEAEVTEEDDKEEKSMSKKKKKFVWKWWHYLLILFAVLAIAFAVYIFMASQNNGPVYGNRCEGVEVISKDEQSSTIAIIKEKYQDEIEELNLSTECRQLKVDIVFKAKMDTKKAQKIAEETVQTLDKAVGKNKADDKTYSELFGTINGETQYEVNVFMTSQDSEDFPIYGTKSVKSDSFSYTLASVKDEESAQKAKDTLKDDNN